MVCEISRWFTNYNLSQFKSSFEVINGTIHVDGDVFLSGHIPEMPYPFGTVTGNFDCRLIGLKTLKNSPRVIGGSFNCGCNFLKSLQYGPFDVSGDFDCRNNLLRTLRFAPHEVYGDFNCEHNFLTSLKHSPKYIGASFNASDNWLWSLKHAPEVVGKYFYCTNNLLFTDKFHPRESLFTHRHHGDLGSQRFLIDHITNTYSKIKLQITEALTP